MHWKKITKIQTKECFQSEPHIHVPFSMNTEHWTPNTEQTLNFESVFHVIPVENSVEIVLKFISIVNTINYLLNKCGKHFDDCWQSTVTCIFYLFTLEFRWNRSEEQDFHQIALYSMLNENVHEKNYTFHFISIIKNKICIIRHVKSCLYPLDNHHYYYYFHLGLLFVYIHFI